MVGGSEVVRNAVPSILLLGQALISERVARCVYLAECLAFATSAPTSRRLVCQEKRNCHGDRLEAVLDWLAQVLRLDPAERLHLYLLARGHAPTERPPVTAAVSTTLQALLDAVPYPAYAVSADWTVVAWNNAALLVIGDFEHLSGRDRNYVWRMFTDPSQRRLLVNWEDQAKSLLSLFRSSTAHNVEEDWYDTLVADLSAQSPEFRDWWRRHDVRASHAGPKEFNHPVVGRMLFEPVTLRQGGQSPLWVMFKVPVTEANTPVKLSKLLAQSAAKDSVRKRSVQRKSTGCRPELQKRAASGKTGKA